MAALAVEQQPDAARRAIGLLRVGDKVELALLRDGQARASPVFPLSSWNSEDPQQLGAWMEAYEQRTGGRALAIPHNANLSNGRMFPTVEAFGKPESKLRVLLCSDVASEGINLHYLSHRLVHFDLPWSLMVFQQRNGRIDRYGQSQQPLIRYLLTASAVEGMGDVERILQVLIRKDEQAQQNIGDPAVLLAQQSWQQATLALVAAAFLAEVKKLIENPALMLL